MNNIFWFLVSVLLAALYTLLLIGAYRFLANRALRPHDGSLLYSASEAVGNADAAYEKGLQLMSNGSITSRMSTDSTYGNHSSAHSANLQPGAGVTISLQNASSSSQSSSSTYNRETIRFRGTNSSANSSHFDSHSAGRRGLRSSLRSHEPRPQLILRTSIPITGSAACGDAEVDRFLVSHHTQLRDVGVGVWFLPEETGGQALVDHGLSKYNLREVDKVALSDSLRSGGADMNILLIDDASQLTVESMHMLARDFDVTAVFRYKDPLMQLIKHWHDQDTISAIDFCSFASRRLHATFEKLNTALEHYAMNFGIDSLIIIDVDGLKASSESVHAGLVAEESPNAAFEFDENYILLCKLSQEACVTAIDEGWFGGQRINELLRSKGSGSSSTTSVKDSCNSKQLINVMNSFDSKLRRRYRLFYGGVVTTVAEIRSRVLLRSRNH